LKHYAQKFEFRHFERNLPVREAPITFTSHMWHKHGSPGTMDYLRSTVKYSHSISSAAWYKGEYEHANLHSPWMSWVLPYLNRMKHVIWSGY